MKVVDRMGVTSYKLHDPSTNKTFRRSVSNLAPWTADTNSRSVPNPTPNAPAGDAVATPRADFVVGNTVAFLEDGEFWLADVMETDDMTAKCHYRGTVSRKFKSARFSLVWIEAKSGLCILGTPKAHERADAWTGTVCREDVLLFDVRLTAANRVAAASRRGLTGRRHAILRR